MALGTQEYIQFDYTETVETSMYVIVLLPVIAYDWPNYESEGSRHWRFFIIVGSTEGLALLLGLRPHFRRL